MTAPYINVEKVDGGFEYSIGPKDAGLVIGRSRWFKSKGEWRLSLITMTKCSDKSAGTLALSLRSESYTTCREVFDQLRKEMAK